MSIPHLFHLTSPTTALSWEERRIVARLHRTLPDWTCKHWDDAANSALMHRAFPHLAAHFDAIGFGLMKAHIARYAYMHVDGGFYFDTYYKLLAPLSQALLDQPCVLPIKEGMPGHPDFKLGNAVFGSDPGHPFWASLIEHIFVAHLPERLTDHRQIPRVSGPTGLSNFYLSREGGFHGIYCPERDAFHPDRTWFGLGHRGGERAVGSHLCWASWRGKSTHRAVSTYLRRKLSALPI